MAVAGKLFEFGVDSAPGEKGSALVRFPLGAQELVLLSVLSPLLPPTSLCQKRLFASDASLSKVAIYEAASRRY